MKNSQKSSKKRKLIPIHWKFCIPIIFIIAVRLTLAAFPESPFWGMNFLGFLPLPLVLLFSGIGLFFSIPAVSDFVEGAISKAAEVFFPDHGKKRLILHGTFAIAIGILFWTFFIPFSFLGDGVHIVRALYRYGEGAGLSYGTLWTEPLTVAVYLSLIKLFATEGGGSSGVQLSSYTQVFQYVSYFVGAGYVFMVLHMSSKIAISKIQQLALCSVILCSAGILFYFGYVEYYAFLYLFGTLLLLCGAWEISFKGFPKYSTWIFIIAIAFHLSALVFLPAYILLLLNWSKAKRNEEGYSLKSILVLNGILIFCAFTFYIWMNVTAVNSFFIPLFEGTSKLTLLSAQHLLDVLNNLFIDTPFGMAIILAMFFIRRELNFRKPEIIFVSFGALYWFLLCLSHSAIARDWDVYALLGVSTALFGFLIIRNLRSINIKRYYLTQMILQPLIFIIPWVAINTSFERSVERYFTLAELYAPLLPSVVSAGHYETLRSAFITAQNVEYEIGMILRTIQLTNDSYEYYKLERAFRKVKSLTPALLSHVETALRNIYKMPDSMRNSVVCKDEQLNPITLNDLYFNLLKLSGRLLPTDQRAVWTESIVKPIINRSGQIFQLAMYTGNRFFEAEKYNNALEWYARALEDSACISDEKGKSLSSVYNAVAISHVYIGNEQLAIKYFRQAVEYQDAVASTWSDYGFACYRYSRFSEAKPAFEQALKRDSTITNALYCLGKIYLKDPVRSQTGKHLLKKFLTLEQNSPRADDAREILQFSVDQLRSMTL